MVNIRSKLGKKIRSLRLQQGMSQEDLGFHSGLHRTYVGSVERGERNISLDAIYQISRALGTDLADLFSFDVAAPERTESRRKKKRACRKVSENSAKDDPRSVQEEREILIRKQTSQLQDLGKQLRNLCVYLQNSWEAERLKVARRIHDDLGQSLTAVKLELSSLRKRLREDPGPAHEQARYISDLVESALRGVKLISEELRPAVLDHIGLASAVSWEATAFENRSGIPCSVTIEPEEMNLDPDRSTAVFRIFQEALSNVDRHANASQVNALLKLQDGGLLLQIDDDGKGIADREASGTSSLGLIGMRERVHAWGGSFAIRGNPNQGTTLTVRIPLNSDQHIVL